jgi:hypothetical protein
MSKIAIKCAKPTVLLVITYSVVILLIVAEQRINPVVKIPIVILGAVSGFLLLKNLIMIGWEGEASSPREALAVRIGLSVFAIAGILALILQLYLANAGGWLFDVWEYVLKPDR